MFKSLKRVLATASVAALLATNVGVAFAQTFRDVSTSAWYYDFVEQLVNDGVVEPGNNYRPNDPLNRAELVKMVVTAVDGLADYSAPASPTFDDVPSNAWYYDYVESAIQLGIVEGYKDARGNLTGKFGPGNTVNRAEATKILVNAFGVETTSEPASIFSDVRTGAWFYPYVVTAYNQSVLDGYANGMFGPADPVTRAQVAKLVVNAQNTVLRTPVSGGTCGDNVCNAGETASSCPADCAVSTGALEVSLNDMTAASSTLPLSASSVKLASFDFTAAQDDIFVSNLVVTRGGVGKASDWNALYIYEGALRLTTGRSVNADTNTATFALNLTIDAGTTTTLTLVGDIAAPGVAGPSNQHYFYIASAADVTSNGESVAGDFPVAGNTFTMGGAATFVNTVTVSAGSAISQPQIGAMDAEVSSFKLQAGSSNDIALHQISITQNGSLSSSKMKNLRLLRGTDEVATAAGFTGDRVSFVLGTPYIVPKGQTKSFYVRADIDGGRTTDSVQLYLDEDTDLVAIDQQYGYGAIVANSATTGFKPGVAAPLVTAVMLKGGTVTVSDNGPAGKQVAQNTTNVQLLNYSITAGRDLTVKDMDLTIDLSSAGTAATRPNVAALATLTAAGAPGTTDSVIVTADAAVAGLAVNDMISMQTASGTVYAIVTAIVGTGPTTITTNIPVASGVAVTGASAVTEKNPYDLVKNVKIVDLDSGSTVQGPLTKASDGTLAAGAYTKKMSEDYELIGGEARHLSVQADIDQTLASGYKLGATINYATVVGYIKDMAANENVAVADIVGGALTGKLMSVAANSLTVTRANTPTSQTFVKGEDKVPTLGITLTSGDAGEITIKKLNLRVYGETTPLSLAPITWNSGTGDTAANNLVSSVTLYDGNDVVDGPRSLTLVDTGAVGFVADTGDYYKVLFDNLNIKVAKGSNKTLVAKAKLLNGMSTTSYIAMDMIPSADIIAEDVDANTITASATALNGAAAHTPVLTVVTSGTLSATSESSGLESKNLVAGSNMQLVAKYKFNALREGFTVNKMTVVDMGSVTGEFDPAFAATTSTAVGQVVLKYPDINGVTVTKSGSPSAGLTTMSDLGFYVGAGQNAYVEVYANVNDKVAAGGEKVSGQMFRLGLQGGDAIAPAVVNTVSTFEAVGVASSTTFNDTEGFATGTITVVGFAGTDTYTTTVGVETAALVTGDTISNATTATLLAAAINALPSYTATAVGNVVTVSAIASGAAGTLITTVLGGAASAVDTDLSAGTDNVVFNNASSVSPFIVRTTIPTFTKVAYGDISVGKLFGLKVNADSAGPVLLGRLVFKVKNNTAAGSIGSFTFEREGSKISDVYGTSASTVNLWNADVGADATLVGGTVLGPISNEDEIIVSFNGEETIPAGGALNYILKGIVTGAAINETVTTSLSSDDAQDPVTGKTGVACTTTAFSGVNGNTARIHDTVAACGLFPVALDFGQTAPVAPGSRDIIWSDGSADSHGYPSATVVGTLDVGTGSYDWTNGYLLKSIDANVVR